MAGFIEFDFEGDPEEWVQRALDALQAAFPGWQPNEAHLEVALIEELARIAAEAALVAVDVPSAIFRAFGEKLVGLVPIDGAAATLTADITMVDNAGYTLPAGTRVAYRTESGEYEDWITTADAVTVAAGSLVANAVPMEAAEVGTERNGLAIGTDLELVDAYEFVDTIVTDSASAGGVDAETDEEYEDRLADELTLLSPTPILAEDFAVLAKRTEGVYRALALDGYDPDTDTYNNERTVGVAGVHEDGTALTAPQSAAMEAALDAMREVNFVVKAFDPTYTDVDVTFNAVAEAGYDPAVVEAAAEAAVADYLDPANWGGGDQSPPVWELEATVRLLEVAAVLNDVDGLRYVTLLTLGTNGGAQAAADVALAGDAPLPSKVEAGGSTVVGAVV